MGLAVAKQSFANDLAYWKRRVAALDVRNPVVRWSLTNAGTVFMGGKSGELLAMNLEDFPHPPDQALTSLKHMVNEWGLHLEVLHANGPNLKLVIFDADRVEADLAAVPNWAMQQLDLPPSRTAKAFFSEMRRRWSSTDQIPHEIGFGLGYPAKDVLGFMGLADLSPTAECGWRVYGDPAQSLERGREMAHARALALACVA